ncbi:tetratricopeptide repeat protein [Geofilum rubicundum]|uniref:TPR repeat n=1 Tax=Geofilum rubicundum JCM 15548 TaxID=1236989 RepID=A0A0E9M1D5_9BACT|nr:tetratricopeptide repeat protein [Geofilum rubicundum]GAO31612.1 TPR repeat precursor [Geofilum rubicundum JCM 15548]
MHQLLYIFIFITVMGHMPMKAQVDTDRMTIIGRNALYFEDYVLAIQYFNHVIRAKPYLSEPYYYRAIGKYSLDDLKGAEQDISKSLEINPYYVDAYNLRGIIRQKLGRTKEAIADYDKGMTIDPENINLIVNKGIAQINSKEYDKAIETYSDAIQLSPTLVSAWLNRGLARLAMEDTTGGLEDFTKAISLNPFIPDGYANRSIVYYQTGNYEASLNDVNEAIQLRPDDARFYLNRGIIRYQMDDLRGTVEDFDKVIELEPRNAMAYSNRGILRAQVGDTNRAIEDFSRVLALKSDDWLTLYYRAMLYMEIGEWQRALADLNIVADNYPDFAPVFQNRSHVKQMLGDNYGAELDYGTAVKLELERREQSDQAATETPVASEDKKDEQKGSARKATRTEKDTDIRNYDKVAVLDDFGNEPQEEASTNPLRGRIQDRNIIIDMEQVFGLTFYPGDTLVHRLRYFNMEVDALNRRQPLDRSLELANVEEEPDRETAADIFTQINDISEQLKTAGESNQSMLYFVRGTLYNTVLNLNNALEDFNRVLELDPAHVPALFNRAYTRYKMVETIRSMEAETPDQQPLQMGAVSSRTPAQSQQEERRILDYDLIQKDLEKVLEIDPDFEFAHYNLGMIQAVMRNFEAAIEHFSVAIEANPDFAEAWFNRGLTNIFLENDATGTLDLSKAGELGIFEAYNVIKRYGISSGELEEYDEDQE